MNQDRLYGIWKQFSGKAKEQWGALTDDPVVTDMGTRERRAGRIQEQRGIAQQNAERQLEDFMNRHRNWRNLH